MPLSAKLIEAVLVEQDPEGLISMGAPDDEYESIAEEIYFRLARLNGHRFIDQSNTEIIKYISTIAFVMNESFGSGTSYRGDSDPEFYYDKDYIGKRLNTIKVIAKLILDIAKKEIK